LCFDPGSSISDFRDSKIRPSRVAEDRFPRPANATFQTAIAVSGDVKNRKEKLAAFKCLYDANAAMLIRFTLSELPEDIVQDVFLEFWVSRKVTDEASTRSFVFTAVRNR
jgi:hypothetical protein